MKIGNLVKSAMAWGPDDYGPTEEYYPVGVIYRQHKTRVHRWWVEWVSPEHLTGEKDCMLDDWLEILNEGR
jgi:hypothetical protein